MDNINNMNNMDNMNNMNNIVEQSSLTKDNIKIVLVKNSLKLNIDESFEELIKCPISKKIFYNPVTLEDGHTYEQREIEEWLKYNNTSPITRAKLKYKEFNINFAIKQIVENYLLNNEEKKIEQYESYNSVIFNIETFRNIHNLDNQIEYLKKCGDLEMLINYKYSITYYVMKFDISNKIDILKFLVKNKVNKSLNYCILECEESNEELYLSYIKTIIENCDDLNSITKLIFEPQNLYKIIIEHGNGNRNNLKLFKYLHSKGANFDFLFNGEKLILHLSKLFHINKEIFEFLITIKVELNCEDRGRKTPLYYFIFNKKHNLFELGLKHGMIVSNLNDEKLIIFVCNIGCKSMVETMLECNYHEKYSYSEKLKIICNVGENIAKKYFSLTFKKQKINDNE